MSIDNVQKRLTPPVAEVSPPTLFACLDRLTVTDQASRPIGPSNAVNGGGNGPVPLDQVIEIASSRGLSIDAVQLDWQSLQSAIAQHDVLLVLQNSNVVAALENSGKDSEEILVSDPLYQDGKPFLLPRDVLEDAWQGDTLVVKRNSESQDDYPTVTAASLNPESPNHHRIVTNVVLSLLGVLIVTVIILYFAIDWSPLGPVQTARSEASNPTTTMNVSLADSEDRSGSIPRPLSMQSAEQKTLASDTDEQSETSLLDGPKLGGRADRLGQPAEVVLRNAPEGSNNETLEPSSAPQDLNVPTNTAMRADNDLVETTPANSRSIDFGGSAEGETTVALSLGKTAPTPSAIEQQEPHKSSSNGIRPALEPASLEEPETEAKSSEPTLQVVSQPVDTEGSATASKRDGRPIAGPSEAGFAVEAAPTNGTTSSAPIGTPATVPEETLSEASYLLDYGDASLSRADITSARLYYQRAADSGSAQGALRLGGTYDPSFLAVIGANERMGDILLATKWYQRAVELGAVEAKILLEKL